MVKILDKTRARVYARHCQVGLTKFSEIRIERLTIRSWSLTGLETVACGITRRILMPYPSLFQPGVGIANAVLNTSAHKRSRTSGTGVGRQ